MSARKVGKQSHFIKYLKLPIRALALVRDMYVRTMTDCASHLTYGNAMGCPMPNMPRSFSTNSTRDDDLRDLIKSASMRTKAELIRSKSTPNGVGGGIMPPLNRSKTVSIGRIDEDKAFEHGGEDVCLLLRPGVYTRSKSYGLSRITSKRV